MCGKTRKISKFMQISTRVAVHTYYANTELYLFPNLKNIYNIFSASSKLPKKLLPKKDTDYYPG